MRKETKPIEFAILRHAYITVRKFLENESQKQPIQLKTKIVADLGLRGDDNYDILMTFIDCFELDHKQFEYDKHFQSEGDLFGSKAALLNLLNLSIWLPLKTIELLTLNKIKIDMPDLKESEKIVSDMSLKDLITWYIEGEYKMADQIRYEIETSDKH